jgi:hypothetical protein
LWGVRVVTTVMLLKAGGITSGLRISGDDGPARPPDRRRRFLTA